MTSEVDPQSYAIRDSLLDKSLFVREKQCEV